MSTLKPDDIKHPKLREAVAAARQALAHLGADGTAENEDAAGKAQEHAGDRFLAWVGEMDGHPWYTRMLNALP